MSKPLVLVVSGSCGYSEIYTEGDVEVQVLNIYANETFKVPERFQDLIEQAKLQDAVTYT